jgi:ribosomal protein L29
MAEDSQETPTMSLEEMAAYKIELKHELDELEFAQALFPSEYKYDRIKRLRQRLGIKNKGGSYAAENQSTTKEGFKVEECE